MKIIIRILRTFKNILFPKIYMPWEQNDLDKNICIRYDNGKWWHYSTNDGGQWTWW